MARSNQRGEFKGRGQDRVRLPQPAMRQLQPMPVAPPTALPNIQPVMQPPVIQPPRVGPTPNLGGQPMPPQFLPNPDGSNVQPRQEPSNPYAESQFEDMPQIPRFTTQDMTMWTNPITGKQESGGSSTQQYQNRLKQYFDANPGAQDYYNSLQPPAPVDDGTNVPQDRSKPIIGAPDFLSGPTVPGPRPTIPTQTGPIGGGEYQGGGQPQNGVVMPTDTNAGITGINNPVPGQINPVMTQVDRGERISDSNLREAYFGSPDTPGIINTAYEAAQKSFLDNPAIGKQVAGLSPLEMEAMQGAYSGIGSYQPYLDAQQSGILEGLGMSRRAGQIAQPYFAGQEQYLGGATEQARQAAGMQFDPSTMTQAYFDPFEDRVVQQTMDDVFKQGDIADVAQRARDIQSGGESAFGSRARLTADERRSSLGRGLGEALARIRSSGFQNAQSSAMGEFGRQQQARERYGDTLSQFGNQLGGIGATRSALTRGIGSDISGYGGQIGGLGSTQYGLGSRQRDELANLGGLARGVSQAGLDSSYDQAYANRMAPTMATSYVGGFLPQFQGGQTRVNKTYGMPRDPLASGISTMLGTYGSLQNIGQPNQNPYTNAYNQYASQQGFDPSGNYS